MALEFGGNEIRKILLISTFFMAVIAVLFGSYQQAMTASFMIVITGIAYIVKLFCPYIMPVFPVQNYAQKFQDLLETDLVDNEQSGIRLHTQ